MKKLFWFGIVGLTLFEAANVYFIMPMPGSQKMNSIDLAYFFYRWRWLFRGLFGAMIIIGLIRGQWKRKWVPVIPILLFGAIIYFVNFKMAADHMFYQPEQLTLSTAAKNKVDSNRLVIGVVNNGEAKAYPIQYIGYHHQVQDVVGGKAVIVTYCTVCRTGRVFEPLVDGKPEKFRLVGMDHFNAMLEDATTKSWWRQATGAAVTGKLKGKRLPEFMSTQTSLANWLRLNPNSLVMQADTSFKNSYDTSFKYESGKSRRDLTGTDSLSWKDKSWVIGIKLGDKQKAYDWNRLKEERMIQDEVNNVPLIIVLAKDDKSFFALQKPTAQSQFTLNDDILSMDNHQYRLDGQGIDTSFSIKRIPAYQEFWHSWRTFNPATLKYFGLGRKNSKVKT